jgi:hypothetical protein
VILAREDLYRLIWNHPVQFVANSLGISGVALAKWCKKLQVPTPGPGYWPRLYHGKAVKRTPLVRVEGDSELSLPVREEFEADIQELLARSPAGDALIFEGAEGDDLPDGARTDRSRATAKRKATHNGARTDAVPVVRSVLHKKSAQHVHQGSKSRSEGRRELTALSLVEELKEFSAALASRHQIDRFLAELEVEASRCAHDPSTSAAIALYISRARQALVSLDPLGQVLRKCRELASGRHGSGV